MPGLKRSVAGTTATPELTNHSQNEWLSSNNDNNGRHRIYPVTEGVQSAQTADVYKRDEKPGKKLAKSTIKVHLSAILYFFQINNDDFNLTLRNFRIHLPSDEATIAKDDDRPYTTEEIDKVLRDCNDLRSKVAVLLLCSTGMRVGSIPLLRMEDLTKIEYQKSTLYRVQVYARTRDKYYTFCTPECYNFIQDYLEYRIRRGEEIKGKSPLIREQFNKDNPFTINSPRFISKKAIEYLLDQCLKKCGIRKPGEVHMSHGFRKFFMTQCERSGMKSINVKMLLGHDIGVSGHYYRPAESDILEDFVTHSVDALTISSEHRLQKQIQQQDIRHSEEWETLKREMNELRHLLFPSPVPVEKERRKLYLKHLKADYKEKGIDVDVSNLER